MPVNNSINENATDRTLCDLDLQRTLLADVQKYFKKVRHFRESQEEIITALLSGQSVMANMPTGSGKSLCYQYPAIKLQGLTLVVTPLIALIHDQTANFNLNFPDGMFQAAYLISNMGPKEYREQMQVIRSGRCKLLYVSPERLLSPKFIRFVRKLAISMLVVDEAHCISMWGFNFRPAYLNIPQFMDILHIHPRIAAFTATATDYIKKDIETFLGMKHVCRKDSGYIRNNLTLSVVRCQDEDEKYARLLDFLEGHKKKTGIIYCPTREKAAEVYNCLTDKDYKAALYHGGMEKEKREKSYQRFMKGYCRLMVCTNAFGMGIDKGNISFILHFAMPLNLESYSQEIGRAGRNGRKAECVLYTCAQDKAVLEGVLQLSERPGWYSGQMNKYLDEMSYQRLAQMEEYGKCGEGASSAALWEKIDRYFHETLLPCPEAEADSIRKLILKKAREIHCLYTNETRVCTYIRNGELKCNETVPITVSGKGQPKKTLSVRMNRQLTYFDTMVADAVYTLQAFGKTTFYPKNILGLLSGDPSAAMRPEKDSAPGKNKRALIVESLEKMMAADIELDLSGYLPSRSIPEPFICGKFLPLERHGKNGYTISQIPPLYRYAELEDHFFTVPQEMLCIYKDGAPEAKMPNSAENLKLRHFLARRILMIKRSRSPRGHSPISASIKLIHKRKGERDMLGILGMEIQPGNPQKKRTLKNICQKVTAILTCFVKEGMIYGFRPAGNNAEMDDGIFYSIEILLSPPAEVPRPDGTDAM